MFNAIVRTNLTRLFSNNSSSSICKSYYVYFSTYSKKSRQPINTYEYLLQKHHFSPEVASHVASSVTTLRNQDRSDSLLSYLKDVGFTKSQLEKIFKTRPELLLSNPDTIIKPKIKIFQDFGFSPNDIAHIISKEPHILHTSAEKRVIPALSLLKGLLGSNVEVVKAVRNFGWLIRRDLGKNMMPNIKFLNSYGIAMEQIVVFLKYHPGLFLYKPEVMMKSVDKVNEMGIDGSSKAFIYAIGVVGSMTNRNWDIKLEAFRNILEFSEDDILRVFKHNPRVFKVSKDKLKKVKEVIYATGKYNASCIVKCPVSVFYSIEKRYKPRFKVLETLESRGMITEWPSLGTICRASDDVFVKHFVRPYGDALGDQMINRGGSILISSKA